MPDNTTMGGLDPVSLTPLYAVDSGDTAWVMICACLVFLMVNLAYNNPY